MDVFVPLFRARTISRADSAREACAPVLLVARAALLLAAGIGALAGCDEPAARRDRAEVALLELERFAFVPAGECVLQPRSGFRVVCRNSAPLLVDRFEVTRGEWREWYLGLPGRDPIFDAVLATWKPETDAWPASFMTLPEAQAFAMSRGLRLLTAREWIRVACGMRALPYPWGVTEASSVANTLNLGVGHPLPVGTFEQGRTPLSTYDMAGNVWEWVTDPIVQPIATEDGVSGSAPAAWAMGGSFLARQRRLHELDGLGNLVLHRQDIEPASRSIDIGLRCATDAAGYLAARALGFGGGEPERKRLLAVGNSWGRDAVPLLEQLAEAPGAAPSLAILLEGARQ